MCILSFLNVGLCPQVSDARKEPAFGAHPTDGDCVPPGQTSAVQRQVSAFAGSAIWPLCRPFIPSIQKKALFNSMLMKDAEQRGAQKQKPLSHIAKELGDNRPLFSTPGLPPPPHGYRQRMCHDQSLEKEGLDIAVSTAVVESRALRILLDLWFMYTVKSPRWDGCCKAALSKAASSVLSVGSSLKKQGIFLYKSSCLLLWKSLIECNRYETDRISSRLLSRLTF